MAEPDLMILCESIGKKARFLEETVGKLGVKNVRVAHARAEDYRHQSRGHGRLPPSAPFARTSDPAQSAAFREGGR